MKAIFIAFFTVLVLAISVHAQPVAVDGIDESTPERKPTTSTGLGVQSESGNTTQLDVNATVVTDHWQGYYGNISGEITLDDADSNTLFSWNLATVSGEIFATNSSGSVSWANITCVNLTNTTGDLNNMHGATKINASTLNQQYFISDLDEDNFTGTFTNVFSGSIDIGSVTIDGNDNCPLVYTYASNQSQSTDYSELLMFDNDSALVFTTIIEPDQTVGFDGSQWNFQALVAQANGSANAGTYYFYVELS